jgi:hypothetical protein
MKWTALVLVILLACKTSKPTQDPWIGKPKQEVLMKEGVPEQTSPDGKDGLVYHVLYENYETPPKQLKVEIKTPKEDKLAIPGNN